MLQQFWLKSRTLSVALCLLASALCSATAHAATTDIVSASSGQCVSISGASTAADAAIVQGVCSGLADQDWTLVAVGKYYHIVSASSGQCLNVSNGSKVEGDPIIQWPCQSASSTNDQWSIVPVGEYYEIVSAYDGQCLNVEYGSGAVGAALIQWPCQAYVPSGYNDLWSLAVPTTTNVLPSVWSPVIDLPVTPIAIANLPNGKLLMWSAYAPYTYEGDIGEAESQTYTAIFDPVSTTSTPAQIVTNTGADMFCPGTAVLFNGNVLVNGGSSSPKTSIYEVASGQFVSGSNMNIPRGYEADAILSTGNVLTLGGSWSGGSGGKNGEIWNSTASGWTVASGIPETNIIGPDPQGVYRGDNHLWMFAQSNGTVFQAGPSAQMNWISTTANGGNGSIVSAGNRGTDPYSINGNAVLYDIGKILKVGGAPAYQQNSGTTYATNSAYLIDITGGYGKTPAVTQLTGMTYERAFSNSVVLPNGDVVVIGGQSIPEPFTDSSAILVPELWSPVTKTFSLLNPMQTPRTYHSTAILLPDGRVFEGGGGQCGTGCPQNHLTAEILTPPYLLNSNGTPATRPTIVAASTTVNLGGTIAVTTGGPVSSFALMRLSATTHTVNNDQRRIPLAITTTNTANAYTLTVPSDPGVALPGYYMLFALNANGVPSVSTTVLITNTNASN